MKPESFENNVVISRPRPWEENRSGPTLESSDLVNCQFDLVFLRWLAAPSKVRSRLLLISIFLIGINLVLKV